MSQNPSTYIADHSETVLRVHSVRTAENSSKYLLQSGAIKPDSRILDIGCGPGTITVDLANLAPQGHVIGIEPVPDVLEKARAMASERGIKNIEFKVGDVHALDFPDNTFDIVHVHQVLQHVPDPVQALREMRRVTKPGGTVAVKEGEVGSMIYYPDPDETIQKWLDLYLRVAEAKGNQPRAGRRLLSWALKAGFTRDQITSTAGTYCTSGTVERTWWANVYADRMINPPFKTHALETGLGTEGELNKYSEAMRKWGQQEDGWLAVIHGEILCRV